MCLFWFFFTALHEEVADLQSQCEGHWPVWFCCCCGLSIISNHITTCIWILKFTVWRMFLFSFHCIWSCLLYCLGVCYKNFIDFYPKSSTKWHCLLIHFPLTSSNWQQCNKFLINFLSLSKSFIWGWTFFSYQFTVHTVLCINQIHRHSVHS